MGRKFWMLESGLGSLLALAAMVWLGMPASALEELAWPVVLLTSAAMGTNVGEHWAKRGTPPAAGPA
jgi:hypothetical protein